MQYSRKDHICFAFQRNGFGFHYVIGPFYSRTESSHYSDNHS